MEDIFFKTKKFRVLENEDQETNPYRYGKELAHYLCSELRENGHPAAETHPEDWGWFIICPFASFSLEIGCGNVETVEGSENPELYKTDHVIWTCFIEEKIPFFKKIFNKVDPSEEKEMVYNQIREIISGIPDVRFIPQSEIV